MQEIITYIIIGIVFIILIRSAYRLYTRSTSDRCAGCSGCELRDIKRDTAKYKSYTQEKKRQ